MWQIGCWLLEQLIVEHIPNEIAFNATISACEKAGRWQLALLLLRDLKQGSHAASATTATCREMLTC